MRIFNIGLLVCLLFPHPSLAQNAIFFHPDGMGVNTWGVIRSKTVGADGELNWDKLPHVAVYKGHMSDKAAASSNGGATAHAYGIKSSFYSYGLLDTNKTSVAHEALQAGKGLGLVNSGTITEPGTGAFVARVKSRNKHADIAAQIISSGAQVILSGGEEWLLPQGATGRHGKGKRNDGRNLIEEAKKNGYEIVYDATELAAVDINKTRKLLGVFASKHTFNDVDNAALGSTTLPFYSPTAPTIEQMVEKATALLSTHNPQGFLLIAEEEGTDNFVDVMNANGVIEAGKRADEALGTLLNFTNTHPNTTLITTSDSDAGSMQMSKNNEVRLLINEDVAGGIVVRAAGKNAGEVKGTMDNTEIAKLLRHALNSKP